MSKVAAACGMAVMGKASIAGYTKTRLAPPLSYAEAAQFNTAFLKDVIANLSAAAISSVAGGGVDIAPYIAYGPAGSQAFFREHLPADVGLIEACLPDFGACLWRAVETLLTFGHASVGVLNADSPTLPTAYLQQAVRALELPGDRAVLGPSADGGYYFLGIKHAHRRLFESIEWSSGQVAAQTRERAAELGLEMVLLGTWYDVDDAESLRMLYGELVGGRAPCCSTGVEGYAAPHARQTLTMLCNEAQLATRLAS